LFRLDLRDVGGIQSYREKGGGRKEEGREACKRSL